MLKGNIPAAGGAVAPRPPASEEEEDDEYRSEPAMGGVDWRFIVRN